MISQINLIPDTFAVCEGDVSILEIKQKLEKNASITWTDPYLGITENAQKKLTVLGNSMYTKKGKYLIKLKVVIGKSTVYDSTNVVIYPKPQLNFRDTILCKGNQLVIDAKNSKMKYSWNTGETSQKIKVENTGNYWVKVNNNGCIQSDTINVKFLQGATPGFNSEVSFCLSEETKTLSIKTTPNTKILWSTGAVYPSISIIKDGTYWVKTENKNCGEQTDTVRVRFKACDCEMMIPNSFTPNEDNRNDYFFPVIQCEYTYYNLTINDKWGNTVFSTNNINGKWDGRFKGNLCPEEIYFYKIESAEKGNDKKQVRNGHLSLFR